MLMPFVTDDPVFTLGFECGQIFTRIQEGEVLTTYTFHEKNIKQVELIMETFGTSFTIEVIGEGWATITTFSIIDA